MAMSLLAEDIVVFNNEYKVLELPKKVKKLLIGNKDMINVSLLSSSQSKTTSLKIFGKKSGNTSMLVKYKDGSIVNYHVYVNQNLGFVQKMINMIEPTIQLSKIGDGSTTITGTFKDPHNKKRIYDLLQSAGVDLNTTMDITQTEEVNKMIRTKLYLVEINNQKAKDLGGVTGLGFFDKYLQAAINPTAVNGATFSGWLLDNTGALSSQEGTSVTSTLNFLQESGLGKILDDTVLMTTEDKNASFRVGGDVYIPIGMTQNLGFAPTIQLEEKQYGLFLTLNSKFMEKDGFVHINVNIEDSAFDTNKEHDVQLGEYIIVPSFISKNINTNVVVKSGQVIVLGGRLHTEDTDSEEKIPFLGDIPLLGELFTHTVSGKKENDLLFFLVPEIVDANENVDETGYYKDFKQSSQKFHEDVLDTNETTKEESLVVLTPASEDVQEPIIEANDGASDKVSDEPMEVIELEDTISNEDMSQPKVITVDEPQETQQVQETSQKYAVSVEKVFLRDKPVTGFRANVWKKGHAFVAGEEKVVNGATWYRVKENCYKECEEEPRELWISQKYIQKI